MNIQIPASGEFRKISNHVTTVAINFSILSSVAVWNIHTADQYTGRVYGQP